MQAQLTVADLDVSGGHIDDAFNRIITFIGRNFGPERETARVRLLELFEVVGTQDERVAKARQGSRGSLLVPSALFTPLQLRSLTVPPPCWVSPMCQYSCHPETGEGVPPNDWHLMHLGSFAAGGAALILSEAAAVNAAGRISPWTLACTPMSRRPDGSA